MFLSFLLHIVVVALLLMLTPSAVHIPRQTDNNRGVRNRILLQPVPAPSKGGGGSNSIPPPSRGRLPRYARYQSTPFVPVSLTTETSSQTYALKVRDGLDFGLDEQAIDAVKQWRFRPAMRDGKALAIVGTSYLTFRLL